VNSLALHVGLGALLGALLAWLGRRFRLLTSSGQLATWGVTAAVFAAQGWVWGAVLVLWALSAGAVTVFRRPYKEHFKDRQGDLAAQNHVQILTRLGWPTALALLSVAVAEMDYLVPFVGALATAGADVWATELGMLQQEDPRLIITRRRVAHGTPGAISLMGLTAALGAAWLLGFVALLLSSIETWRADAAIDDRLLWLPLAALVGGLIGSLTDSLLGATAQAYYHCEVCDRYTEEPEHTCGREANQVRGWPWMTNEVVDLVSTVVGASVTAGVAIVLAQSPWPW
jgi:uncharacterized protein (TIGR00297 family)